MQLVEKHVINRQHKFWKVILTEESYTSKASALDSDYLPTFNSKSDMKPVFSGKRVKRGLYMTSTGKTINADTNGSLNIARTSNPKLYGWDSGIAVYPSSFRTLD